MTAQDSYPKAKILKTPEDAHTDDIVIDESILLQLIRTHSTIFYDSGEDWWRRPIETIELRDNKVVINLQSSPTVPIKEAED